MTARLRDHIYAQRVLDQRVKEILDKFDEIDPEHTTTRRTIIYQEFRDMAKTIIQSVPSDSPALYNTLQYLIASRQCALLGIPNPKPSNGNS